MFDFVQKNTDIGISVFFHSVNEVAFCLIIEDIDWNRSVWEDKTGFNTMLKDAVCLIDSNTHIKDIPLQIAQKLDGVLRKSNEIKNERKSLNFTGVSLTKENVYVTTAGYCRVHLVQDGNLLGITKDHNILNDYYETPMSDPDLTYENLTVLYRSQTRALGFDPPSKPPESIVWDVEGDYSVLICSNGYHYFRDSSIYLDSFMKMENLNLVDTRPTGLLARVDRKKSLY